ncbi:MAG: VRR-NUC domain-containing protein [Candidatus Rokubacteria bacterium]|nr:VRR-NUC domain-containing protein [Candidatus Rokubacteria bacterium]
MKQSEGSIQDAIRLEVGAMPDVRLWRNNGGVASHADGSRVRYGLAVGSADLIGILRPSGRFIALEVKRPGERETPKQRAWLAIVQNFGGFAAVVSSVDEARQAVQRAREGASE